ncbi:uncharacterized protein LOC131154835 isoform X2 [Malania oleifera]|uniref:uncharacterized protein LOC131154835 isoform X2 n=1 Tax=Malania oleifera TaxID=397392 RepID=UPI0025AE2A04|nr:uncharacterized protein LOC131154835 isoform X2 [Malania oleifera]
MAGTERKVWPYPEVVVLVPPPQNHCGRVNMVSKNAREICEKPRAISAETTKIMNAGRYSCATAASVSCLNPPGIVAKATVAMSAATTELTLVLLFIHSLASFALCVSNVCSMAGGSAAAAQAGGRTGVRIVVAGDRGTGKSSLIVTAAAETFPPNVFPLLPPTKLLEDLYPDRVPVTIIDTSSSVEGRGKLADELRKADKHIQRHTKSWQKKLMNG